MESIIRPFETRNVMPPSPFSGVAVQAIQPNVVLSFGKGASGKTGTKTYDFQQNFYMTAVQKEVTQQT